MYLDAEARSALALGDSPACACSCAAPNAAAAAAGAPAADACPCTCHPTPRVPRLSRRLVLPPLGPAPPSPGRPDESGPRSTLEWLARAHPALDLEPLTEKLEPPPPEPPRPPSADLAEDGEKEAPAPRSAPAVSAAEEEAEDRLPHAPDAELDLDSFRAHRRLWLQRALGVLGTLSAAADAITDPALGIVLSLVFLTTLLSVALFLSRYWRHRVGRHWYLLTVAVAFHCFYLPQAITGVGILTAAVPLQAVVLLWVAGTAASSRLPLQCVLNGFILLSYVVLKRVFDPDGFYGRSEAGIQPIIALVITSAFSLVTAYSRLRETERFYVVLRRGRETRRGPRGGEDAETPRTRWLGRDPQVHAYEHLRAATPVSLPDVSRHSADPAGAAPSVCESRAAEPALRRDTFFSKRRPMRRWLLRFGSAGDEEGYRRWLVATHRLRTILVASGFLLAYVISLGSLYANYRPHSPEAADVILYGPLAAGAERSWRWACAADRTAGAALPAVLLVLAAAPVGWRALLARGWSIQHAIAASVLWIDGSCLYALYWLPGGRLGAELAPGMLPDVAAFYAVATLAGQALFALVALRVRFFWSLAASAACLAGASFVASCWKRFGLIGVFVPCCLMSVAACWELERESRLAFAEQDASRLWAKGAAAGRSGAQNPAHASA